MALNIDFNDPDAWDDNALVDTWNEALEEYKKFHSIHASGKKLVDALTKEELEALQRRGIQVQKKRPGEDLEDYDHVDGEQGEEVTEEIEDEEFESELPDMNGHEDSNAGLTGNTNPTNIPKASQVPQIPDALMNSVPDEALRNLMMSWYWAGYYTGFHQGQNSARSENS